MGWASGTAVDYNDDQQPDSLNAFGVMLNVAYEYHKTKAFVDVLYASGDNAIKSNRLNGFMLLNRNRRPGLILGRELLGNFYGNDVGRGSLMYYGDTNSLPGAFYVRPGLRVDWSQSWATGLEFIIAQKAATPPGQSSNLGLEIDLGTDHAFYKNFDLGLTLGYLFPGAGLGVADPKGVFAVRGTASVKF